MASTLFSGTSRYSADFVQVIERSVAIASLPLTQMQQQRLKTNDESAALKTVEAKVLALKASLLGMGNSLGTGSWQTSSSDTSVLRPSSTDGVAEGTYTLQVNKLGVFSTAVSTIDPGKSNSRSQYRQLRNAWQHRTHVNPQRLGHRRYYSVGPGHHLQAAVSRKLPM